MNENKQRIDAELEKRLEEYVDTVRPGERDSAIPPLTFAQYLPAIVVSIVLTVAVILVGIFYYPL